MPSLPITNSVELGLIIDGLPIDETKVGPVRLADHTHATFHEAATTLRESNTPELILNLLMDEIDELIEVLEENPNDSVNLVAELGDLFHFWNDLLKLSISSGGMSFDNLLSFIGFQAIAEQEITIAELKELAAVNNRNETKSRDLLYELKGLLILRESDAFDAELLGTIAHYIMAVAADLKINIIYATLMKNLRNRGKYDPAEMNVLSADGWDYEEIRPEMVRRWNNGKGGDGGFFEDFLVAAPLELAFTAVAVAADDTI